MNGSQHATDTRITASTTASHGLGSKNSGLATSDGDTIERSLWVAEREHERGSNLHTAPGLCLETVK
jgi:hypothetical protein